MSIDRELEQQDGHDIARSDNPDYLQEQSSIVASLKNKEVVEEAGLLENVPYSQRYQLKAQKHIDTLESELAGMRTRGDYGVAEIDPEGKPLQDDMSFIAAPSQVPKELSDSE